LIWPIQDSVSLDDQNKQKAVIEEFISAFLSDHSFR